MFDLANHLLLLDPAWNPAAEWQCFDRVHRLGQDKDVCIYKFITKVPVVIFYQGSIFYILPPPRGGNVTKRVGGGGGGGGGSLGQ